MIRFIHGFSYDSTCDGTGYLDHVSQKQCVIDEEVTILDVVDRQQHCEMNRSLEEEDIRVAQGFVLIYSIMSRGTFERISMYREHILRVKGIKSSNNFPMMLVATKCDESIKRHPWDYEHQVSIEEGQELAKQFGCKFVETSAAEGIHVDDVFMELVRDIRRFNKVTYAGLPSFATLFICPPLSQKRVSRWPRKGQTTQNHNQGGCVVL
ncbi:ras family-domain-containing protein [Mycena sp. CBHHK59/15]|nr:ras family-domain-containing protein [Mycena sp. CBHHK59/15]